jgi:hypothetical protein
VNIAGAQLNRFLQKIADRANDRCARSKIAQAFDVVFPGIAGLTGLGRCRLVAEALVEGGFDVLERGDPNRHVAAKHNRGRLSCRMIAGVGDRKRRLAVGRLKRKNQHFTEETLGESLGQRLGR